MNKLGKILAIGIMILFLALYLSSYTNQYYENKNILTEEAIHQFEKDLKTGKEIIPSNYLPKEKEYDNKISKIGRNTSEMIEKIFNKSLKSIMKYLEHLEN